MTQGDGTKENPWVLKRNAWIGCAENLFQLATGRRPCPVLPETASSGVIS